MLITFKSKASGDVIMLGQNGKEILRLLGKDADASQGIVTVGQLPDAITRLQLAVVDDKARHPSAPEPVNNGDQGVRLAQRALPVLDLLQRSLQGDAPVTWGV